MLAFAWSPGLGLDPLQQRDGGAGSSTTTTTSTVRPRVRDSRTTVWDRLRSSIMPTPTSTPTPTTTRQPSTWSTLPFPYPSSPPDPSGGTPSIGPATGTNYELAPEEMPPPMPELPTAEPESYGEMPMPMPTAMDTVTSFYYQYKKPIWIGLLALTAYAVARRVL